MPANTTYWTMILSDLKTKVSTSQYKAWFGSLSFVSTSNKGRKLTLSLNSRFAKEYIENKFKTQLQSSINKYYPQVVHIDFQVAKSEDKLEQKEEELQPQQILGQNNIETESGENEEIATNLKNQKATLLPGKNLNNLNPKYTFENFVITSHNELAASVAKAIIREPSTLYNPVFVYSAVGLGKTHLLQAIGHKMLEVNPSMNIKYATCETFFNHYISSIHQNKGTDFRDFYRKVDLLLLDDIQFIAGKDATQEAFFHTFNELHQNNKQIVITSDKPPKMLGAVEERLISRFEWGMLVDILRPDLEARLAITKDKVQRMKLAVNEEQILQIAQTVDTNVRDIEGVLNQVQARIKLSPGSFLPQNQLDKMLSKFNHNQPQSNSGSFSLQPQSTNDLLDLVAKTWHITKEDILGKNRQKNVALARQVAMYLYQNTYKFSLPAIGKILGGRDHSTILYGCRQIEVLIQRDPLLQKQVQMLVEKVG